MESVVHRPEPRGVPALGGLVGCLGIEPSVSRYERGAQAIEHTADTKMTGDWSVPRSRPRVSDATPVITNKVFLLIRAESGWFYPVP